MLILVLNHLRTATKTGIPNKRMQDINARLDQLGCNPIKGMADIDMDECNEIEIRNRIYAELAGYVAPKRKAVQVDNMETNRVIFNICIERRQSMFLIDQG